MRYTEDSCTYGQLLILDFDLWIGEGVPLVPVRMSGTDFNGRVTENQVLDVPDPDPSIRPVAPLRVTSARNPAWEVVAHYPGRDAAVAAPAGSRRTILIVAAAAVAVLLAAAAGFYLQ